MDRGGRRLTHFLTTLHPPSPIPQPPHVSRSRLRLFTMPRRRRRSFDQPSRRCPTSPPRCVRDVRCVRTTTRSNRCVQHWVRVVRGLIMISENAPYLPVSPHPSLSLSLSLPLSLSFSLCVCLCVCLSHPLQHSSQHSQYAYNHTRTATTATTTFPSHYTPPTHACRIVNHIIIV